MNSVIFQLLSLFFETLKYLCFICDRPGRAEVISSSLHSLFLIFLHQFHFFPWENRRSIARGNQGTSKLNQRTKTDLIRSDDAKRT